MDLSKVDNDKLPYNLTIMNNRQKKCIQYKITKKLYLKYNLDEVLHMI